MSASDSNHDQPTRQEIIVAYLDGELSPTESARVEDRLATDEQFRRELQSLDKTWSALDELPRETVPEEFSQTTMELVVSEARREVAERTQALPVQHRKRSLATVFLALAVLFFGVLAARWTWVDPNEMLLEDLPVIANIDVYSQFRDVDFLRELQEELEERDMPLVREGDALVSDVNEFQTVAIRQARQEWLDSLPEEEETRLRAKYNRFRLLSDPQKQELRDLHQAIVTSADAPVLEETMLAYSQWLNSIPLSEQFELRGLESHKRVRKVIDILEDQLEDKALELNTEQLLAIEMTVRAHLDRFQKQIERDMLDHEREIYHHKRGKDKLRYLTWIARSRDSYYSHELNEAVLAILPRSIRQRFDELSPRDQRRRLSGWIRQAMRTDGQVPEEELERFFAEELDAADQEQLLSMPRKKMQEHLRRMYEGALFHSYDEDDHHKKRGDRDKRNRRGERDDDDKWRDRSDRRRGDRDDDHAEDRWR